MTANILITGSPGSGKTTLIRRITNKLSNQHPAGFYTQEIRKDGIRRGFEAVSFNGDSMLLADVDIKSRFRVGKYGVDVTGFEQFLSRIDLTNPRVGVIVIDEIGKMECYSESFRHLVSRAMDSDTRVLATIAARGGGFIEQVKGRPDTTLIRLHQGNRDALVEELLSSLVV